MSKKSVDILKAKGSKSELKANAQKIFNDILKTDKCVTFMIKAEWCGHCVHTAPIFEKAFKQVNCNSGINCYFIETTIPESNIFLELIDFKVQGFPTIIRYHDNKFANEFTGDRTEDQIAIFMCQLCNKNTCSK